MTFKEDFKPSKVYNKLVNDVCYNADTDKGIVIANKDLYATEVIDIGED